MTSAGIDSVINQLITDDGMYINIYSFSPGCVTDYWSQRYSPRDVVQLKQQKHKDTPVQTEDNESETRQFLFERIRNQMIPF